MKLKKIKWWKVVLMLALSAFFLYGCIELIQMLHWDHGDWVLQRHNVQPRAYEALFDLFLDGILLIPFASCLIGSLICLVHCFIPRKKPSVFVRLTDRFGVYPLLIVLAVLLLLFGGEMILRNIIGNTPDVGEVPATLGLRTISGHNCLAISLALVGTITMLTAWVRSLIKKKAARRKA